MNSKSTEKKTERVSKQQKEKMVEYMASNMQFARGQFSGINSNFNYKEQWEALKATLNALGGSVKTVEQWKKCWIDLKCGVKKSVNSRRKFINQTGGGSWADVPRDLNALEEKVLQIITEDAVDGDACTPESGIEPVEESVEFLEDEVNVSAKKLKITPTTSTPYTSKCCKEKRKQLQPASSTNIPKYKDALDEAKQMQNELIIKLNKLETQNEMILQKLDKLENLLENKFA